MSFLSRNSHRHVLIDALDGSSPSVVGKFTFDGSFNFPHKFSGVATAEVIVI